MQPIQSESQFTAKLASGFSFVESPFVGFVDLPLDDIELFYVTTQEQNFGVNLSTGVFFVNDEYYAPKYIPKEKLRLIYFKTMRAQTDIRYKYIYKITIGWQATVEDENGVWHNIKFGIKIFPQEQRWELGADI